MTFPGAGARVEYNEAGEPLGWDYPSYDEPAEYDERADSVHEHIWQDAEDQIVDELGYADDQAVSDRFDELWQAYKNRREGFDG